MNMKNVNKTILHFHIGRGGRFNNPGFLTFEGVRNLQDVLNLYGDKHWWFIYERDAKGRFCTPYLTDSNGNSFGLTVKEIELGIGIWEIDNDFNTHYTKYAEDLNDDEIKLVLKEAEKFDGEYCWNYPLDEILSEIDSSIITKAAEKGKLIDLYETSISYRYSIDDFVREYLTEEIDEDWN
jgi:hypothetical protein